MYSSGISNERASRVHYKKIFNDNKYVPKSVKEKLN